jgi:hypothetical protein
MRLGIRRSAFRQFNQTAGDPFGFWILRVFQLSNIIGRDDDAVRNT